MTWASLFVYTKPWANSCQRQLETLFFMNNLVSRPVVLLVWVLLQSVLTRSDVDGSDARHCPLRWGRGKGSPEPAARHCRAGRPAQDAEGHRTPRLARHMGTPWGLSPLCAMHCSGLAPLCAVPLAQFCPSSTTKGTDCPTAMNHLISNSSLV